MKGNLIKRRTEFLNVMSKGAALKETVEDFSKRYQVVPKTLYNDWEKRKEWLPQILQLQDETIIYEALQGQRNVLRKTWLTYLTTKNDSIKIAALKLAREIYNDLLEFSRDLSISKSKDQDTEPSVDKTKLREATSLIADAFDRNLVDDPEILPKVIGILNRIVDEEGMKKE